MRLALSLGSRRRGRSWPNPSVGCVLVKNGRIVARGCTGEGGRPHAETVALDRAGPEARGCTAYVTLEPCSHVGVTPPCAAQLAEAGIARAVVALIDPDPRVSGRGIAALEAAGIAVETGLLEQEARRAHRGFLTRTENSRPAISLKLAMSLDGRIATSSGDSKWISGPEARRRVHLMRSQHDAVMVGRGTAAADNPNLTPRGLGIGLASVRIVIDTRLSTPADGQLGQTAADGPVWLCHGADAPQTRIAAWKSRGATPILCGSTAGRIDLQAACRELAGRGLNTVFCEGGSRLSTSLFRGDLVDEFIGFTAGAALGGRLAAANRRTWSGAGRRRRPVRTCGCGPDGKRHHAPVDPGAALNRCPPAAGFFLNPGTAAAIRRFGDIAPLTMAL